jgi:hypothetical protein
LLTDPLLLGLDPLGRIIPAPPRIIFIAARRRCQRPVFAAVTVPGARPRRHRI